MKITRLRSGSVGPLSSVDWEPGSCEVIYDDNQRGKTTLIDILVSTTFKEGNFKLFQHQDRYSRYPDTTVWLENRDASVKFGKDGDDVRLSELLGWRMPEIHRLLCVRAGEVSVHGLRDRRRMWRALASVVAGVGEDYLKGVRRALRRDGKITSTYRWSNRGTESFRDRLHQEVIPRLERAEDHREQVGELLRTRQRLEEVEAGVEECETELENLRSDRTRMERQRSKRKLMRCQDLLDEAQSLRRKLEGEYARVVPQYQEEWNQRRTEYQTVRREQRQKRSELESLEETLHSRREELREREEEYDRLGDRLRDRRGELRRLRQETGDRRQRRHEQREERVRPLVQQLQDVTLSLNFLESRERLLRWATVAGLLSLILGGLVGLVSGWMGMVIGGVGVCVGGLGGWSWLRQYRLSRKLDRLEEEAREELQQWPSVREGSALNRLRGVLSLPRAELAPEADDRCEELQDTIQQLQQQQSRCEARVQHLEERVGEDEERLEELRTRIRELTSRREGLESRLEDYRDRTGQPDYEQYSEKLAERQRIEGRLNSLKGELSGRLEIEQEDPDLSHLATRLERLLGELEDVDPPSRESQQLDEALQGLREQERTLQERLQRLEERRETLRRERSRLSSQLADLGVDPNTPSELFESIHGWKQTLHDAVRDRAAAALALEALDRIEQNYLREIRLFLQERPSDDPSLSELFARVMGDQYTVRFRESDARFEVEAGEEVMAEEELSTGARTHLYFCCRLAILPHLFRDQSGFFVLDDPFLPYFPPRKEKAIELLRPLIEAGWQVLLFTVDPSTRDHFSDLFDARVRTIDELTAD